MSTGETAPTHERLLLEVNAVAISPFRDRPEHEFLFPHVRRGFDGDTSLLVFDYLPLRAQSVRTEWYDVEAHRSRNVVQRFVRQAVEVGSADRETILEAYEVSAERTHDVSDAFLVALARHHEADAILATDTDFEDRCRSERFDYLTPVPTDVLARFHAELES